MKAQARDQDGGAHADQRSSSTIAGRPVNDWVSEAEIASRLETSRRTVKRLRKEFGFPTPIELAPRTHRFNWLEVEHWLISRPRVQSDEPLQLRAARALRKEGRPAIDAAFGPEALGIAVTADLPRARAR